MPPLFSFEVVRGIGVTWHVMTLADADIPAPRCRALWEQEYPDDSDLNPFWRYGVNNQDGEALAVWRSLAWTITEAPLRAVIPRFDRDQVADYLGVPRDEVALVDWEYEVNYESGSFELADRGFVPAHSSISIRPEPTGWERQHLKKAGLFRLMQLNELHRVDTGVSFDVASEMSLFGLPRLTFAEAQATLSGPERPALVDVLGDTGVLAHMTIVRDRFLGHHSYFGIAARRDLSSELEELTNLYEARWERYIDHAQPTSFANFVDAMEDLLSPVDGSSNHVLPGP